MPLRERGEEEKSGRERERERERERYLVLPPHDGGADSDEPPLALLWIGHLRHLLLGLLLLVVRAHPLPLLLLLS